MKRLLLFTIILAMAILAQPVFAQPDSLNMTLLDEWEIPNETYVSLTQSPFCFIDSFILIASEESTYVLKIDSTDHFQHVSTHSFNSYQLMAKDSLLIRTKGTKFTIYDFNGPYDIDSIGGFINDTYMFPYLDDSLVFYFHPDKLGRININNPTAPFWDCVSNHDPISQYGPFFDGQYLYLCGKRDYGDIYEEYSKAVLEVYDPVSFADSIAFMGRYFFGPDSAGSFCSSYFVDIVQDSFMIYGNHPNSFSLWKTNETRSSFEFISSEPDSDFGSLNFKNYGDTLAFILGSKGVNIYDISNLPDYSLVGFYKLDNPCTYSLAIELPYIIVQYSEDRGPVTETPVKVLLLKYSPSDGMNCSYNAKEENDFHIFPNPFNSSCSIELANNTQSIEITDIRGNTVKTIENPTSFHWQPQNLPSGLYFITVDFGETKITKKTVYLR